MLPDSETTQSAPRKFVWPGKSHKKIQRENEKFRKVGNASLLNFLYIYSALDNWSGLS